MISDDDDVVVVVDQGLSERDARSGKARYMTMWEKVQKKIRAMNFSLPDDDLRYEGVFVCMLRLCGVVCRG